MHACFRIAAVAALSVLLWVQPAEADARPWSYDGHRLICEVAWRELTPAAKEQLRAWLDDDADYSRFSRSCVWADELRGNAAYDRYITAHYVNLPTGEAGVDPARHCAETYCVLEVIPDLIAVVGDGGQSGAARWEALKLLAHFVGDIHQPLHAGRPGDRGGNGTRVQIFGNSENLHWLWDGGMLQRLLLDDYDAARLHGTVTAVERARWTSLDPLEWANESYEIVERQVYHGTDDGVLDDEYVLRNQHTLERRLLQAGVRLGRLLNELIG
jgi:hypothetical protein